MIWTPSGQLNYVEILAMAGLFAVSVTRHKRLRAGLEMARATVDRKALAWWSAGSADVQRGTARQSSFGCHARLSKLGAKEKSAMNDP